MDKRDLDWFVEGFTNKINPFFKDMELTINSNIFNDENYPIIVFTFVEPRKSIPTQFVDDKEEYLKVLGGINNINVNINVIQVFTEYKIFYYLDEDKIYIMRPNQRPLWTRGQGTDVAMQIISEIMLQIKMDGIE